MPIWMLISLPLHILNTCSILFRSVPLCLCHCSNDHELLLTGILRYHFYLILHIMASYSFLLSLSFNLTLNSDMHWWQIPHLIIRFYTLTWKMSAVNSTNSFIKIKYTFFMRFLLKNFWLIATETVYHHIIVFMPTASYNLNRTQLMIVRCNAWNATL